ncbi:MAG: hypothetical protein EAZ85_12410 [Bacteroidetes bacterium]|nr:MAG: hypothetical protein EAZ85_12410 [Bacteroidota bacterium]TAG92168.1 MAG: hypothetical protein EAZ20_02735 [Bacteroidota bacterium]
MAQDNLDLDRLFFRADNEIKDGLIAEAFDTLTYIIEQDTEYGKAYNHLGWLYETKYKDYKRAEECYRLSLKYSPDYLAIYLNYAILLSTIEKFDELESLLNRALTVPGINKAKIWNEHAIMREIQGRYQEAITSYKQAIMNSLNNDDIASYEQSMQRSQKKQSLLG